MAKAAWKVEQEKKEQFWHSPSRHVFHNSFFIGAVSAIGQRLQEQRAEQTKAGAESRALVLNRDALAKDALGKLHPGLTTGRAARYQQSRAGYQSGQQAGRDVSFNRPVTSGSAPAQS